MGVKIAIRKKINSSWSNLVLAILFGVFSKVLFSSPLGFDDVYITFRYAERFGNGFGLTYNDGENVFGISNLFYSVFLGILVKTQLVL